MKLGSTRKGHYLYYETSKDLQYTKRTEYEVSETNDLPVVMGCVEMRRRVPYCGIIVKIIGVAGTYLNFEVLYCKLLH